MSSIDLKYDLLSFFTAKNLSIGHLPHTKIRKKHSAAILNMHKLNGVTKGASSVKF